MTIENPSSPRHPPPTTAYPNARIIMFVLSIIASTLFVSQVTALATPPAIARGIFARQSIPSIPAGSITSACQSACQDLESISTNCANSTDLGCFCSDASGQAFVKCGNCALAQPGVSSSLRAEAQQGLDSITTTCQQAGHPFSSPLTLSGGSSGASGSSGSSSSSSSSSSSGSSSSAGNKSGALSISPSSALAVFAAVAAGWVAAVV